MANESIVTAAIVLRRADYGDYDRMLTLLSPELGKFSAIARGVKKPKSRLAAAAEPFCASEFQLRERSGRYSVEQCSIVEAFLPIREDYEKLVHAAYWLKLAEWAAVENVPNPELFQLLMDALAALSQNHAPLSMTTLAFEAHYLALLGMSPNVEECVLCGEPLAGGETYVAGQGGLSCQKHVGGVPLTEGARRILLKLPRTRFSQYVLLDGRAEWPEAAKLLRAFVRYHIDAAIKKYPDVDF